MAQPTSKVIIFTIRSLFFSIVVVLVIASLGQIYATFHPSYSTIVLEPDSKIGWKFAPNLEFVHTGDGWYANELTVKHKTTSYGFLGPQRAEEKPIDTGRIVLLGDSFVEALQVPRELSAAGVLERQLNHLAVSQMMPFKQYEVLNFGVSNMSVGQYLLIYEEYASKFSPDYVFIFVTGMQMTRTIAKQADWGVKISHPAFELKDGKLIRHPVVNFEETKEAFAKEIHDRGGRVKKHPQQLWIKYWIESGDMMRVIKKLIPQKLRFALKEMMGDDTIKPFWSSVQDKVTGFLDKDKINSDSTFEAVQAVQLEISEEVLAVNLAVIKELDQKVKASKAKLIVVDASLYFWFAGANEVLTKRIHEFCQTNDIAYIPFYEDLLKTDRNNIWARFPHSHHFNEHGNALFAQNMLQWMKGVSK